MAAVTKTAAISAWLPTSSSLRPLDMFGAAPLELINELGFSSIDMTGSGWVRVGEAQITVTLLPIEQCMADTIAALRREQAELQAKSTRIEGEIQKLLAITCEVVS